jgi:hypothetical protein
LAGGSGSATDEVPGLDPDGNRTQEESIAIRGEVVERDAEGRVIARHEQLDWEVDPISLEGDAGESATRPKHEPN